MVEETFQLELFIRKPPEAVKAWWTDLPDDYLANDPDEQPFRIVTLKKYNEQGKFIRELHCYWRLPDGSERKTQEILYFSEDNEWSFDVIHPLGFKIHDDFRAIPFEGGTRLEIKSKITVTNSKALDKLREQKERMIYVWKNAARICERDAP